MHKETIYKDVTITEVKFHGVLPNNGDRPYRYLAHMTMDCKYEDEAGLHALQLKNVEIPLLFGNSVLTRTENGKYAVDLGFGTMLVEYVDEVLIRPNVREMTLEEIEAALGYKVKIVEGAKQKPTYSLIPCNHCVYGDAEGRSEKCKDCNMPPGLKNFKLKED